DGVVALASKIDERAFRRSNFDSASQHAAQNVPEDATATKSAGRLKKQAQLLQLRTVTVSTEIRQYQASGGAGSVMFQVRYSDLRNAEAHLIVMFEFDPAAARSIHERTMAAARIKKEIVP